MMYFKVADFAFGIETCKEIAMRRRMGNYEPFCLTEEEAQKEGVLFVVDLDSAIQMPAEKPTKVFTYDLTEDRGVLHIYPGRYILTIESSGCGHRYTMECPLTKTGDGITAPQYSFACDIATKGSPPSPNLLDHLLIQAFSFATAHLNTLLVHASTIVFGGKAVMFLAESGTGKSTHTRLWRENIPGAELLNDDAPALRISQGSTKAYGTPWSGKLPCYKNEEYPLTACVRIRRAPFNKIEKQTSINAFGALLPSCLPTMQQTEEMLDNICATLSETLKATRVYMLDCLPDADAARLSHDAIFGQ